MVYINDKKFACEACIKGHRSSSCHHNDRPLFEIKKKGRPVSQCERCREMRRNRRLHSKCMCDERNSGEATGWAGSSSTGSKSRRFVHIAPALPNGLRGAITIPPSLAPANQRQKVESLLNPCNCKDIWDRCRCNIQDVAQPSCSGSGHATVEQVSTVTATKTTSLNPSETLSSVYSSVYYNGAKDNNGGSPRTSFSISERRTVKPQPGPELPPLLFCTGETHDITSGYIPRLSRTVTIPPIKSVASLAGTGCSCGFTCACPGCTEHRVPSPNLDSDYRSKEGSSHRLSDRADGCRSCVDSRQKIDLYSGPDPHPSTTDFATPSQSVMEEFLARAASLPPPPRNRFSNLNPTNTAVFPLDMVTKEAQIDLPADRADRKNEEQVRMTWGLVSVPKLECCGGKCACPDEDCGCGRSCKGCCSLDAHNQVTGALRSVKLSGNVEVDNVTPAEEVGTPRGTK